MSTKRFIIFFVIAVLGIVAFYGFKNGWFSANGSTKREGTGTGLAQRCNCTIPPSKINIYPIAGRLENGVCVPCNA